MLKYILALAFVLVTMGINAQKIDWVDMYPSSYFSQGTVYGTFSNGDHLFGGDFNFTTDLDPGPGVMSYTSTFGRSPFLQRVDSFGVVIWTIVISCNNELYLYDVTMDDAENIYVTGQFRNTADFAPGSAVVSLVSVPISTFDNFLAKYSPTGNLLWAKKCGGTGSDVSRYLAFLKPGKLVARVQIAVGTSGDIDFGGGVTTTTATATQPSYCLVLMDTAGNYISHRASVDSALWGTLGGPLLVDKDHNLYFSGTLQVAYDIDPGPGVDIRGPGPCLVRLNHDLSLRWMRDWSTPGWTGSGFYSHRQTKATLKGNIVSHFQLYADSMDLDPGPGMDIVYTTVYSHPVLTVLDSLGSYHHGFMMPIGVSSTAEIQTLFSDQDENIYVAGDFSGSLDFDPGPGTYTMTPSSSFYKSLYFLKTDSVGNFVWAGEMPSNSTSTPRLLKCDIDRGGALVAGFALDGKLDFAMGASVLMDSSSSASTYENAGRLRMYLDKADTCFHFYMSLDSVASLTCSSPGFASCNTIGGILPLDWTWSTSPSATSSSTTIPTSGLHTVSVSDAAGCSYTSHFIVPGPAGTGVDLRASVSSTDPIQPGSSGILRPRAWNEQCTPANGTLTLVLDPMLSYTVATPSPTTIAGDTLKWNFSSLDFTDASFSPTVHYSASTALAVGQIICMDVMVTKPPTDANPANNTVHFCTTVTGPYDPNFKNVIPFGECEPHYTDFDVTQLAYNLHFQNTGTAAAKNVYLLDTLDADLDWGTVEIIASSHPVIAEMEQDSILRLRFDDINLPDSASDEPGSHGWVMIEVSRKPSLPSGSEIRNSVSIYFDFADPVMTNEVLNTFVDSIPHYNTFSSVSVCEGSSYTFPDGYFIPSVTSPVTHVSAYSTVDACDSMITILLDVLPPVDTSVNTAYPSLIALASSASFQWVDCDAGYMPVPGANLAIFSPGSSGNYAVIVTQGMCTDTSACYPMILTSTAVTKPGDLFSLSPNPASGILNVRLAPEVLGPDTHLKVTDLMGRELMSIHPESTVTRMALDRLSVGVYLVMLVHDGMRMEVKRLVVE